MPQPCFTIWKGVKDMGRKIKEKAPYISVAFAGALWGTNGFFIKNLGYLGIDNGFAISFLRFAFAIVFMGACVLVSEGWHAFRVSKCTFFCCMLLGLFCHAAYNVFYAYGCETAGLTITAVLVNMAPVFTMFFSYVVYKECMTLKKCIAILLNIIGCMCCATNGQLDFSSVSLIGIFFGVIAAIVYSTSAVIGRYSKEKVSPFVVSFYCFVFASIFLLPFTKFWEGTLILRRAGLIWAIIYSVVPTGFSYLFYYGGMKRMKESSKIPVLTSVEIVVATIIAMTVFHEVIGIVSFIGILLVFGSILLINLKSNCSEKI